MDIFLKKFENKKIAVYGMGKSGLSAARFLKRLKTKTFCWDDDLNTRKKLKKFKFNLSKFWLIKNKNLIDYILISPGIDINKCKIKKYLKKNYKKIITDIDIFLGINKNLNLISVTGTNGKSTTCKVIEKILKTAGYKTYLVGNIGKPILSLKNPQKKGIIILEISSYQLQYSKIFRSQHAIILNITPDHLERHKSINNYAKIKSKIFFGQTSKDFLYLNKENKHTKLLIRQMQLNGNKSKLFKIKGNQSKYILKKIKNDYFKSKGNLENLSFASILAKNYKIKDSTVIKALKNFKGLSHRQENFKSNEYFNFVNDSKATSFDASQQSLLSYNKIYWIVGGLPKYKDNFNLNKISRRIVKAYIVGKNTNFFVKQLQDKIPYAISHNIKKALQDICKDLKNSKFLEKRTILLSPAAASFDQFKNFENRGNYFKKNVYKIFNKIKYV